MISLTTTKLLHQTRVDCSINNKISLVRFTGLYGAKLKTEILLSTASSANICQKVSTADFTSHLEINNRGGHLIRVIVNQFKCYGNDALFQFLSTRILIRCDMHSRAVNQFMLGGVVQSSCNTTQLTGEKLLSVTSIFYLYDLYRFSPR